MSQALYRKYRPKNLAEVIGQDHITKPLTNALKQGRISHAYLFTGPRGTGKTSIARILAYEINTLPYDGTTYLDIIEIDAASNRRIDDIRDLRDKVHIAPASASYKVYIIDEVHMLTGESFNALLKTLEEPPAHVIFMLATTEVQKLPATILSRVQRYNLRPVTLELVKKHLAHIANKEGVTIDAAALQLVAEYGEGSFRDSIGLLDQLANTNDKTITADTVERTLGLAPQELVAQLTTAILDQNPKSITAALGKIEQQGIKTGAIIPQLLQTLQAEALKHPSLYAILDSLLDVPQAYNPSVKLLTVLMRATLDSSSSIPQKKTEPQLATLSKPALEITIPKPKPKPTTPAPKKTEAEQNTVAETANSSIASMNDAHWQALLVLIKKTAPPLYSIVRQAVPSFDSTSQTLTLGFRYLLHRKKMEDAKQKTALGKLIQQQFGGTPIIKVVESDQPPVTISEEMAALSAPVAAPTVDPAASAVMDLMGGGVPETPPSA